MLVDLEVFYLGHLKNLYTIQQYNPHMPIGKVLIGFTVCFCLFVRLWISPTRIKLAASNFARWFIGVLRRESPIFGGYCVQM